jgi:co-chaperonin GroES (HSP10)
MIYNQQATATRENNGIAPEDYKDLPLPEDYEIVELLSNVIQAQYIDIADDGVSLVRNGIVLPNQIIDNRAWRIAKVSLVGPDCKQVKKGDIVIFPGDRGLQALKRNGKMVIFLSEDRIFGICEAYTDEASKPETKTVKKKK